MGRSRITEDLIVDETSSLKFHDCTAFFKLDIRQEYHQLLHYPESRKIATFSTSWGNMRPKRLIFKQKHRKFFLMKLSTEPARRKKRGGACTTRHWKQSCKEQQILESLSTLRSARLESKRWSSVDRNSQVEKFRVVKESSPTKKLREVSVEWPNTDQSSSKIRITNCTLAKADP